MLPPVVHLHLNGRPVGVEIVEKLLVQHVQHQVEESLAALL
jgi:hypothetical protein